MLFFAKVQCPACQGGHCRKSHWHSSAEKRSNAGFSPYRCLDCEHRFFTPHKERIPATAWAMIGLIVSVVSVTVIVPLVTEIEPSVLASVLVDDVLDDSGLRRAAENGDHAAQFKLGVTLFEDRARTGETTAQAIRWLEAAAEGGNVDAMVYLGRVLQSGVGILQDYSQAFRWFHAAAMRGSPEGMLETGRLYRDGVGVEKIPVRAYVWFNRAAAAHNIEAVREREMIGSLLTPDDLKEAQRQSSQPARKGDRSSRRNARD
jgi:hypothetical protein